MRNNTEDSKGRLHFFVLITVIIIAGLSQGFLLPVLAIFLDQMGVSPSVNGLNAAALYMGSFAMTLVAEKVLGVIGFKKLIVVGLVLVMLPLLVFPWIPNVNLWFVLRFIVGVGVSALNYAAQLWVLMVTPERNRGRNLSLYGMSYGLGFSLGPLGIKLLQYGMAVPFILMSGITLLVLLLVIIKLPDQRLERLPDQEQEKHRYRRSYRIAWYALIPAFLYGYMEASMNSNFPVYGLNIGYNEHQIATLLPFIGVGGLLLQLPLGLLSDKFGRKKILMISGIAGGIIFLMLPLIGTHYVGSMILLLLVGGLVGSFFSLGLAYAADILPRAFLPAANVIASVQLSIGSVVGPNISGVLMQYGWSGGMFILLGVTYILFGLVGFRFRPKKLEQE
ncbi:MAG TPA: MFS transporter [Paenibacillus sp.]